MALTDILNDPTYQIPKQYNPNAANQLQNTDFYKALSGQMTGLGQQQGTNTAALPFQSGRASNAGYTGEQAGLNSLAAMQPWEQQQGLRQWNDTNAMNQDIWNTQNAAAMAQQAGMGKLLGTGLGAALGAKYSGNSYSVSGDDMIGQAGTQQGINNLSNINLPNPYGQNTYGASLTNPYKNPYGVSLGS